MVSCLVLCVFVVLAGGSGNSGSSYSGSSTSSPASRSTSIENESSANPDDARQARQFLASLPEACSGSRASVSRDGTITIRLSREGANKSLSGLVKIKDGVVREIR